MNRVAKKFQELRQGGRKAFIPYLMGGDPNLETTGSIIELLAENGADLIEVGVPFSDPVADGPVIQQAGVRSLQNGCNLAKLLNQIMKVNQKIDTPLILMIYYNMIFQKGILRFFEEIRQAAVAGLIIPDLPADQAEEVRKTAEQNEIGLNFLIAPTSHSERIRLAADASTGFLYAVSLKGVTGMRSSLPPELPDFLKRIQSVTNKPVAVGFGISTAEQAAVVAGLADGVIIGSAIVKSIANDASLYEMKTLAKEFHQAIHNQ